MTDKTIYVDLISNGKDLCFKNRTPLICVYDAGDCDTISADRPNIKNLTSALFDEREAGGIASCVRVARLPNGQDIHF